MTRLSVNLNKVALLRNQRDLGLPSVLRAAETVLAAGAGGVTVHPRPDQRHSRADDVVALRETTRLLNKELNVEGNPQPEFLALVKDVLPDQVTLVPDDPSARTSDHGWDIAVHHDFLYAVIRDLQAIGIRVSIFVDYDTDMNAARAVGTDMIELYTEPYAVAFEQSHDQTQSIAARYAHSAFAAHELGLGINAGHDLNQQNLPIFLRTLRRFAPLQEVSIGHAFTAEALWQGLRITTENYVNILAE